MIIVKGFLYVIAPTPARWETKVGATLQIHCRKISGLTWGSAGPSLQWFNKNEPSF